MKKSVVIGSILASSSLLNLSAHASECSATYNPATGEFNVPSIIVNGDASGQTFRANFLQQSGIYTFDLTSVEANIDNSICYQGSSTGDTLTDVLDSPNDDDNFHIITAPADAGGGFFTVTMTIDAPDATPWITIKTIDESTIYAGSSSNTDHPQTHIVMFEGAANQAYKLFVKDFFNAPTENYPIQYNLTWSFTSRVDCFEPNNTVAEAAALPLNSTVEAYILAGYIEGTSYIDSDRKKDWYKITLDTPANLTFQLLQVPSDVNMHMGLYDANDAQVGGGKANSDGELVNADLGRFEPGEYYLKLYPFMYPTAKEDKYPEKSIPDHFNTPYKFRVVAED